MGLLPAKKGLFGMKLKTLLSSIYSHFMGKLPNSNIPGSKDKVFDV